jgi:transcriptional regulator with XRE-family HTH domain
MIGSRLKQERDRLDLTQTDFGGIAGVKKRTVIDWEQGNSSPTAVQLSALAAAGVDVQFVLTGIRSLNMPNDVRNTAHQLYLVKSSTEAIEPLHLDKYRAAELQSILCAVARGNGDVVAEAMGDYASSELTAPEKDLLAAYRKASDVDRALIDRLAQLVVKAAEDEAKPVEKENGII